MKTAFQSIMNMLRRLDRWLIKIEEAILSYAIILMAAFLIADILGRNLFNYSIYFAHEVSLFLIFLVTFMGIGYAARYGRHIRMSAFYDLLPRVPRKVLTVFICVVTAGVLFIFSYYSYEYVKFVHESGRVTSALEVPAILLYVAVPVGLVLGGIQFMRNALINIRDKDVYIGTERKDHSLDSQDQA